MWGFGKCEFTERAARCDRVPGRGAVLARGRLRIRDECVETWIRRGYGRE